MYNSQSQAILNLTSNILGNNTSQIEKKKKKKKKKKKRRDLIGDTGDLIIKTMS